MTELEKSFNELLDRYIDLNEVTQEDLEYFFECTLKPEHMKHTEEVRGLIEAAKMTVSACRMCSVVDDKDAMVLDAAGMMSEEALKPFEKEIK